MSYVYRAKYELYIVKFLGQYPPGFQLPECGVIWDPGVRWIWRREEGVVFNILLCVAQ